LIFATLAALLAVTFARWITRPISALAAAAAHGEAATPATPIREVNALAEAYEAARVEAQRLRDAQEEVRHVARLNEMGVLAAALAHEINQPLTAASTFAEAALRLLPDSPAREAMQEAAEQAVHAGAIVHRLRDFLAASGGERHPADLNEIVREAVSLALADARERRIALRLDLAPNLPAVMVDRVQIAQVVVNLVRNAVEAIGDASRRELTVATRRLAPGFVEISVSDTGSGIEPEIATRLFTPFVTTKPGGMGVGLAISRGIVEEHGGRLLGAPNPDGGSVFRVTLPMSAAALAPASEEGRDAR
jgi:two-component system sensor kinase FixL